MLKCRTQAVLAGTIDDSYDGLGPWLYRLFLDGNDISGELRDSWGQTLPHLYIFSIGDANLSGTLPLAWGAENAWPILINIWVYDNSLLTGRSSGAW